jgi:hypothetical protein
MEQDAGHTYASRQETAEPIGETKANGSASSVLGAFFLAITLLIGTWTLLPQAKVDIDRGKPTPRPITTGKSDCASGSSGFKSSWDCPTQSTTTSH